MRRLKSNHEPRAANRTTPIARHNVQKAKRVATWYNSVPWCEATGVSGHELTTLNVAHERRGLDGRRKRISKLWPASESDA